MAEFLAHDRHRAGGAASPEVETDARGRAASTLDPAAAAHHLHQRPSVVAQARLAEALSQRRQPAASPAAASRPVSPKPALQAKGIPISDGRAAEQPLTKPSAAIAARAAAGEEPWWRQRVDCRVGREAHSLYFLGTPEQPELVINPGPTFLTTYLAGFPTAAPAQQAEKDALEKLAKAVRDAAATNNPLSVYSALTQLGRRLGTVGAVVPGHGRPPSHIQFEAKTDQYGNDYGTKTTAHILSVHQGDSPGGSPPVEKSTWATVRNRHPSFVRGHLLNKHLHGPGTGNNLTPLTDTVNRQMSKEVEEPLKTEILDKNNVYYYAIEPTYGGHPPKEGYSDDDLKYIPTRITMTYYPLTLDAGKDGKDPADWKRAGAAATVVPIDQPLPDTNSEKKRGHAHQRETLAASMASAAAGTLAPPPLKKNKRTGRLEARGLHWQNYKIAVVGGKQQDIGKVFAAMRRPAVAAVAAGADHPMAPDDGGSGSHAAAPAVAASAAAADDEIPAKILEAIVAAEETLARDYEKFAEEKLSDDDLATNVAEAMENARQVYLVSCAVAGVNGGDWLPLLQDRLDRVSTD